MLNVICGEDSASSRNYLLKVTDEYKNKGYIVHDIASPYLEDLAKNSGGTIGLFGQKPVYVIANLSRKYSKKKAPKAAKLIEELALDQNILIVDWEEGKSAYILSTLKKIANSFQEFKPQKSIFQLLDDCYPINKKGFIQSLNKVIESQEESFVFAMLCRHVRNLILAKNEALANNLSPWQRKKLLFTARLWPQDKLIGFYEGLSRIDIAIKTSATPYNLKQSLDILACYYL